MEEKYLFPILGPENEKVKKAIAEHRRLSRLFRHDLDTEKCLSLIEEELEAHVRFEERILFNEIQEKATNKELLLIDKHHKSHTFKENTQDEFWK